jgi:hypothetical protein
MYFKSSAGWVGTIKLDYFVSAEVNEKIMQANKKGSRKPERIADFSIAGF